MDGADERIGRGDDHGAGGNRFVVHPVPPFLPKPRHRQHRTVPRRDVVGLFAVSRGLPFKVTGRRYQATIPLERISKHRPLGNRLRPGIEGSREFLQRLLPPSRDQLPAHRHKEKAALAGDDDADRISGTDVVIGAKVLGWLSEPVKLDQFRPSVFLGESAAHEGSPICLQLAQFGNEICRKPGIVQEEDLRRWVGRFTNYPHTIRIGVY